MKRFLTYSKFLLVVFLPLITGLGAGCGSITGNLAASLSAAIGQNNDLETIRQGGPAYLIMVDAFVMDDPSNPALLASAANLYSTYSDVFVQDTDRALRLTDRALGYGLRAVCENNKELCGLEMMDFETFDLGLEGTDLSDVSHLYTLGASWAGWIKARSGSIKALAQIPKVKGIMERVVELDEKHQDGAAHLYLGTLAMILPQILGGEPEVARLHFERGVLLAGTKNLMARVLYAKNYARPMFDRDLHDRLLNEVLSEPVEPGGDSLINTLARNKAVILLKTGDDYF
ncbi:MAG: TRAP transporter TatT component family protein [Desulfobacterium sp.]|jgi:hypothetical protein|nr:TRAP transporter TatT component family protein [Desulfobacterium sp.]